MKTFIDEFNRDKEEINASRGDFFKFKEGANEIRILVDPKMFQEEFNLGICYSNPEGIGCGYTGSSKYLSWVESEGKLKQMKIPYSVMNDIASLMQSKKGWGFDRFPMPYGVTINAVGAGTKEVKYTVLPDREMTLVDPGLMEEVSKKKTPAEIIEERKKKNYQKHLSDGTWERLHKPAKELDTVEYPEDDINIDEIPF